VPHQSSTETQESLEAEPVKLSPSSPAAQEAPEAEPVEPQQLGPEGGVQPGVVSSMQQSSPATQEVPEAEPVEPQQVELEGEVQPNVVSIIPMGLSVFWVRDNVYDHMYLTLALPFRRCLTSPAQRPRNLWKLSL
jgi:hypothetical protein